ncbi:sigma-70 family RNA polymerase sigma factor [Steroidobacter sp.]|uniref:sigma-70 family RNA polymerase sigma factor n=1 Tax=Steroidobacter sp. TaxID=1978227 RepID=UPI001A3AC7E1|nr:sigma-70 family RNA polymerase sigma factor [Steroidobacter sp.]MBL8266022.1 sigma-70 family RNA polymerase sigma factor [Steroidobacter sp.]
MSVDSVEQIYREHHGWLHRWLRGKLGFSDEAADIAHDVFVRLLHSRNTEALREPRAYLRIMARGLLIDHYRRSDLMRAWQQTLAALPEAEAPSAEAQVSILQTLMRIDALLDDLPAGARDAFMLSQLHGMTYADIATHLGVSLITVKRHMLKAFQACLAA